MSKVEFKEFVRKNPQLIKYVDKNETTWQKLYELYDLYGEKSEVWEKYQEEQIKPKSEGLTPNSSLKELFNMVKGVDLGSVQKGLNSLDKAIEAFKGLTKTEGSTNVSNYEPRPTYKYFED